MDKLLLKAIKKFNPHHSKNIKLFLNGKHIPNRYKFEIELGNYPTCIVGEIHKFEANYANECSLEYCGRCEDYATRLDQHLIGCDIDMFEHELTYLYKHITYDHTGELA